MNAATRLLRACYRVCQTAGIVTVAATFAVSAGAGPMGLSPGETITNISIDALKTIPGDGGSFDNPSLTLSADGRFTSVLTDQGVLNPPDVNFHFDALLQGQTINTANFPPFLTGTGHFGTLGGGLDFSVTEGASTILTGTWVILNVTSETINILDSSPVGASAIGRVTFTGGATNLLAALGGVGGMANVQLQATAGDFSPLLNSLASDANVFNSSFTYSLSGTLTPLNSEPFVPEPATALLLAGGLLGMIGVSRRRSRR